MKPENTLMIMSKNGTRTLINSLTSMRSEPHQKEIMATELEKDLYKILAMHIESRNTETNITAIVCLIVGFAIGYLIN